jgi:hypothetical protein
LTIALPGSLGDLVIRADGRPIYCTAPSGVRRKLMALSVDTFRREFPGAEFIDALILDRRRRSGRELDSYGAAIVITRATTPDASADPFDGIAGEHTLDEWAASEIKHFAETGRLVAWQAIEVPAIYWFSRFAIEPFEWISTARSARIFPDGDAEAFRPKITSIFGDVTGDFADLFHAMARGER